MSGWLGGFFSKLGKPKLAGVVVWSVGPRGHSSGSKQGGGRGVTVGWEASEGSHSGMFQLTGHALLHCSVASIIHMYAHKACWEQTSDMQCLESLCQAEKTGRLMWWQETKRQNHVWKTERHVHISLWDLFCKDTLFTLRRYSTNLWLCSYKLITHGGYLKKSKRYFPFSFVRLLSKPDVYITQNATANSFARVSGVLC